MGAGVWEGRDNRGGRGKSESFLLLLSLSLSNSSDQELGKSISNSYPLLFPQTFSLTNFTSCDSWKREGDRFNSPACQWLQIVSIKPIGFLFHPPFRFFKKRAGGTTLAPPSRLIPPPHPPPCQKQLFFLASILGSIVMGCPNLEWGRGLKKENDLTKVNKEDYMKMQIEGVGYHIANVICLSPPAPIG